MAWLPHAKVGISQNGSTIGSVIGPVSPRMTAPTPVFTPLARTSNTLDALPTST